MKGLAYIVVFLFPIICNAQFKTSFEGETFDKLKTEAFNGFIGENDSTLFSVDYIQSSKKKKALIVRKFNTGSLTLIQEKNIYSNENKNYYNDPYEIYLVKDKIYLFSIFTHTKEQTTTIGLFIYDLSLNQEKFLIVDSISQLAKTNIIIQKSQNEDGFLITKNHPHIIAHKEVVDLLCLNLNGDKEWKKELIPLNDIHKINIESTIFPSKNEVYLLCNYGFKNNPDSNVDEIRLLSNKYAVWTYDHQLNFLKEIDLKLKLKWLNGVTIKLKKNGHILVSGFVNSSRTFAINAFFNVEIDNKYEIVQNNYFKIDTKVLSEFLPQNSKKKVLENFFLRDVLIQNDGSFYMIGEKYYKYLDRIYDPRTNTTSTTEHFNYESLLVAYFDDQGKLNWVKHIPKIQNSTNDYGYYSSFTSYNSGNGIYIFYNDYEDNLKYSLENIEDIKPLFNGRKNALVYVKLDKDGMLFRKRISSSKNYMLYAKKSSQIRDDRLYLLLELNKRAKIISLSF